MIKGQKLSFALGEPIFLNCFNDKKIRRCYPFKLKDIYRINNYFLFINRDNYQINFKSQESIVAMTSLLKESFQDEDNIDELFNAINGDNFTEVLDDIKRVNGIYSEKTDTEKKIESLANKDKEIDWYTSVNSIMAYTNNSIEDIKNMTLIQFNKCLSFVGKRVNWEYKISTINMVEKPEEYIDESEHPLSPTLDDDNKHKMTMDDISDFLGR